MITVILKKNVDDTKHKYFLMLTTEKLTAIYLDLFYFFFSSKVREVSWVKGKSTWKNSVFHWWFLEGKVNLLFQ